MGQCDPLTGLRKECYLLRSYMAGARRRKLDFYNRTRFFLPLGRSVWLMHNTDAQCALEGKGRSKGREKIFMSKFFLSSLKIGFYPPIIRK